MKISLSKEMLRVNPVLHKELKVKMRGWKAALLIGVYNIILTLIVVLLLKIGMSDNNGILSSEVVFITYAFIACVQFGLISLIAPSLTAGAISGEREKQTLDILLSTTLKQHSIIIGKLFASLSHIILLVLSSIPMFSIIFLYGIIGSKEIFQIFLFYIVIAITLGSIGLFFSTFIKRSTASNVLSYAVIVFLYLGTIFFTVVYIQLVVAQRPGYSYNNTSNFWLMYFNPAVGFIALIMEQFGEGGRIFPGLFFKNTAKGLSFWQINMIIDLAISAVLLTLSSLKLNPVGSKLIRRKR